LSWFIAWVRAFTAPRRATRRARIASTRPLRVFGAPLTEPDSAAFAAALGIEGVGLALHAARLAVWTIDFDYFNSFGA
jgi:hypothetical protein